MPEASPIARTFERLGASGRPAFIPYITAGLPEPGGFADALVMLADEGADVIELGIPYSDPLADGPTIQAASWDALARGVDLETALRWTEEFGQARTTPIILFTYLNPVLRYGPDRFLADATAAGAAGLLITDLPVDADPELEAKLSGGALDLIRLVAPTTPPARARRVVEKTAGFIYYVSRTGVTGERQAMRRELAREVESLRELSQLPIAVGFGISSGDQAREVAAVADGVVVGSALVRRLQEGGIEGARALARELRSAIDASE